jgi:phenylalanyl-tRNA synthetase beta chain
MKFTLSWLKEHLKTDASLDVIRDTLDQLGLVVDKVENKADALASFIICEVIEAEKHPNADRLKVCRVNTGKDIVQVVCGAANARQGMKAVLALPGAIIPSSGTVLKVGKVRDVESFGMMCSAEELLLETDSEGIIEVAADAPVGEPYVKWLGLDDAMIEIEITPNRGDCLGVHGIARDLAATGIGTLLPLKEVKVPGNSPCPLQLKLETPACPYFTGRLIRGVKNGPSPDWLRRRLESIGQNSISTLVDITNYLNFDRARPSHVFDADLIKGNIVVRSAKAGEPFVALKGDEYTLAEGMTVISDDSGVISLGGIKGGQATGCTEATQNVFLECAFFEAANIAVTGQKLGVSSDARFRFERGVDPLSTLPGLEALTTMIIDLCGGEASDVLEVGKPPVISKTIPFSVNKIESLGGLTIQPEKAHKILTSLGFQVSGSNVISPSWRSDVEGEADLVEEVLRVEGYDKIPSVAYEGRPAGAPLSPLQERRFVFRDKLTGRGLVETVTWSFMAEEDVALFGGVSQELLVMNPISIELNAMRPSLLPHLLKAAHSNQNRGLDGITLFEVGPQYTSPTPEGQEMMASGLRVGTFPSNWLHKKSSVDFYNVKADVMALAGSKGQWETTAPSWYHPGRSATLKLGPQVIGYCGELHPRIVKAFDLKGPVVAFEVFIDRLPLPKKRTAVPLVLSPYQAVERDFAFVVDPKVPADTLIQIAAKLNPELVNNVTLFDVFEREGIKSLGIRVRLQSTTNTLSDAEIQAFSDKFIATIVQKTGATLRE